MGAPFAAAPYVVSLRFDLQRHPKGDEGENDDDVDFDEEKAYREVWVKAASEAEGVLRVLLYRADSAVGNMKTSEREIYGGGPGKQVYLVLIEQSASPEREAGGDEDAVRRGDMALRKGMGQRANEVRRGYWLEIAHGGREGA